MRTRFHNLEPERQERLIKAAVSEFCSFGYEEGSLNRILKQGGMSKSSFYYYFDDKLDVFQEVARQARNSVLTAIKPLDPDCIAQDQFWTELEGTLLRAHGVLAQDNWPVRIVRLHYHLRVGSDPQGASSSLYTELCGWITALVAKGRSLGCIRADLPETLLVQLSMGLAEAFDRWMTDPEQAMSSDDRDLLITSEVDLFRRMLAT